MYDYIIIGGGPAGSTIARLLKNKRILLIEQSDVDSPPKLCGGLIAPDAQKWLGKFELSMPKDILVDPQMFYVESKDLYTGLQQRYKRHYLNVDRKKFDNWLLDHIPTDCTLLRNTQYLQHQVVDGILIVTVKQEGVLRTYQGHFLIGVDGGASKVRMNTCKDFKKKRKYIAIQSEVKIKKAKHCYEVYFHKKIK